MATVKETAVTTVVTVVITAALTVVGVYIKQQWIDPFAFTVLVSYINSRGQHVALASADVVPQINNVEGKKTNLYGEAIFQNVEPHPFTNAAIQVRHDGYAYEEGNHDPEIPIRKRADAIMVLLRPTSSADDNSLRTQGGDQKSAGGGGTTGHPNQVAAPAAIIISTCRSGPLPSGNGKNFSSLYTLCSDASSCNPQAPGPDYVIQKDQFELVGDRRCNAWSQCTRESSSTPHRVCYAFQMQGHDEWQGPFGLGGSGEAFSEGVLSVTWAHK